MYTPSEDSFFFKEFLKKYFFKVQKASSVKILDMGTGTGILAEVSGEFFPKKNIFCVDIQKDSVALLRKKGFVSQKSDLFEKIDKKKKFDLILFNAPYLPADYRENEKSQIETTGGERGDEISIKFLKGARNFLKKNGKILLLVSSLTPLDKIKRFKPKLLAKKKIWFEELLIFEFSFN